MVFFWLRVYFLATKKKKNVPFFSSFSTIQTYIAECKTLPAGTAQTAPQRQAQKRQRGGQPPLR